MVTTIKILFLSIFIFSSCCEETSISFEQSDYFGDELNLNGYYYSPEIASNTSSTYFFYSNGVILYGFVISSLDTMVINQRFRDPEYTELFYDDNSLTNWGLFEINDKDLKFEKWEPRECSHPVRREGEILNNESFVITKVIDDFTNRSETINDTFFFVPFNPKPDSTNMWIN